MSATKVTLANKPVFRRFDIVRYGFGEETVVRVKSKNGTHIMICKKIKWSRFRIINKLIRLWIIIRY